MKTSDWRGRRVVPALFHACEAALVAAKNARVASGDGETLFERRPWKVVVVIVLRDVHGDDGFGRAQAGCARLGDEGCELFGGLWV